MRKNCNIVVVIMIYEVFRFYRIDELYKKLIKVMRYM